ncbi:hypothetical protein N9K77_01730 [bacterium]|nr:hypothetical protein [bacterium]
MIFSHIDHKLKTNLIKSLNKWQEYFGHVDILMDNKWYLNLKNMIDLKLLPPCDIMVAKHQIPREEQDLFAIRSHDNASTSSFTGNHIGAA